MVQLSEHFSLEEMTFSQTASRLAMKNNPPDIEFKNLVDTANKMESVRTACGNRVVAVSSGYRSPDLNRKIGGARFSAHMAGYACDFRVAGLTVAETIELIAASKIRYDQLINEYGRWVHISFDPRMRHQKFVIT